jgi:hypothetical protein
VEREPAILTDVRFLLTRMDTDTPPSRAEIASLRGRLVAMRAHPSCSPTRADRLSAALMVLDVVALSVVDSDEVLAS